MKSSRKRLGIGECPHYETRTINIHKVPFYYPLNSLEIVKITHFYTIEFHPYPIFLELSRRRSLHLVWFSHAVDKINTQKSSCLIKT